MNKKVFQKIARGLIVVALLLSATNLTVFAQETRPLIPNVEYFIVETKVLDDGTSIDEVLINGPPTPPVGYERTTVELPEPSPEAGVVTLSVPAYNWSFGCSATSASMIAAFYDRGSYPGMYTGPTNNGIMPMDNSAWGDVIIAGEPMHQCPLSATRNGLDGRTIRGHVDDYWIQYEAAGPDPYVINSWTEHTLGDCTADYMKTNKWFASENFNTDGATTFWYYTNGAPITATNLESHNLDIYDGGCGLKLFYESRGETVDAMYNRGADPRASQEPQGACTLRLREAQSGPVPCSGARRQNKVLDGVSAAILGGVAAENQYIYGYNGTTEGFTYDLV
ncbi:MAG: hypothetical protein C4B58_14085 [Deltaproteobacteria bacterium]|nr:MAG: hypothetical protein C4B58_14085 [Deltaproteobacteria bacterium]